jgi:hypothetical protein
MSVTPKVPRESAAPESPKKTDFVEAVTKLFTSGAERAAEVQKKAIDVAAQQSAEVIDLWKKTIQKVPGAPGLFLLELAGSGIERYAETQKGVIELVLEQSCAWADLVKDRTATATRASEDIVTFAQESAERVVATQKKAIDHGAEQTRAAFESAKKQFGSHGGPVGVAADSIQRGVNAIVDAQKELLDMAVR